MKLPSPKDLKKTLPLSPCGQQKVHQARETIRKIFDHEDPRLLLMIGPCSIHHVEEGIEYAEKLQTLAEQVKDFAFVIMRAYIEKPRTKMGWKGLAYDPHLNGAEDLLHGLSLCRHFLVQLAEMGVPVATEFLTPCLSPFIEDLISWGCIGARTSSSQVHRLLASHLPMPIGFKNSLDGNINCAANGVFFSRNSHSFMHIDEEGKLFQCKTKGNPYAHVVLRGSLQRTNYDPASIQITLEKLRSLELPPRVLIDCSHGNCQKKYFLQKEVFQNVFEQYQNGNRQILGMMLESNLEKGAQLIPRNVSDLQKGVSITDPCLDYSETLELVSSMSMSLTHS